jgi:phage repressor protein C with HTH and peptisase S24 domain
VRRGDRVVLGAGDGEIVLGTLRRQSANAIDLGPLDDGDEERGFSVGDVAWIGRIVWSSQ